MVYEIFRSDKRGYRIRRNRQILQLELTEYGIFRPKINGMWGTQTPHRIHIKFGNRPFYRYGGHLEFRGNYGMPRGQMRNN